MGHEGLKVGVQMVRKFVIRPIGLCYRSVHDHPFLVGVSLILLSLYRASPIMFSLLVSASPVLVCTAVLLGTLLSFGESNIGPEIEEDEKASSEHSEFRMGVGGSCAVVERDVCFGKDGGYIELRDDLVVRSVDEEPLLESVDRVKESEEDDDLVVSSMFGHHVSREIDFGMQSVHEARDGFDCTEDEQMMDLSDQIFTMGVEHGVSSEDFVEHGISVPQNAQAESFEDYRSAEGSVDEQMRDHMESSAGSENQLNEHFGDILSPVREVQGEDSEDRETAERSVESEMTDQVESSSGSWTHFDTLKDRLSSVHRLQMDSYEDYISREGSVDVQIGSPLELSLGSWNHFSEQDRDDESDSGSDGAESSSPDASMADIIPMLDELHPLLEDENMQTSILSRQGSAATMGRSTKSCESSIHSDEESDQRDEEEAGDANSNIDDDNEEEAQGGIEDLAKSAVMWTEKDQKNLMDLGTSELERNHRLESLIARRRARRMVTEKNLIDLEGMDLSFPIVPISTARYNPFDNPNDSYADLPPIPGSAPSIMSQRRNPFDLPYDSSEEKPDLTDDGFQEEYMELSQRESSNPREAVFRRNETFSMGSSIFDYGRPNRASRFRPYFVPERTDSDAMSHSSFQRQYSGLSESRSSYSSLRRQSSELSESRASSVAETDSIFADADQDEMTRIASESGGFIPPSHEISHASDNGGHGSHCLEDVDLQETNHDSDHSEHGSHSLEDLHSLSEEENETLDDLNVPMFDISGVKNPLSSASCSSETGQSAEMRQGDQGNHEADNELSAEEVRISVGLRVAESIKLTHSAYSALSESKECDYARDDDALNRQFTNVESVYPHKASISDIPTELSGEEPEFSHATEVAETHLMEPLYDSSPLALEKNLSSSSIYSDINLYHVQRDLFAVEESKSHDEPVPYDAMRSRQEEHDGGLTVDEITEVIRPSISRFPFSEINLLPRNPLASAEAECDIHLSEDSSATRLVKIDSLDAKGFPEEAEQVLTLGDNVEAQHGSKLSVDLTGDNMPSADEHKSSEDLIFDPEGSQLVSPDHVSLVHFKSSSSEVEVNEGLEISMNNFVNDTSENMFLELDEAHFLPHDSVIHQPMKQETSTKVAEISQVTEMNETVDNLDDQEPAPLQNDESSSSLEDFEKESVAVLSLENNVYDLSETKFANTIKEHNDVPQVPVESVATVANELIMLEDNDANGMDDALLSELDAVGDFSMKDIGLNLSVESDIHEQVIGEFLSSSGMSSGHGTMLGDSSDQNPEPERNIYENQNSEPVTKNNENIGNEESIAELRLADIREGFVHDRDTSSKVVREEVVAESVSNKISTEEGALRDVENELLVAIEEYNLDASRVETKSELSVVTEVFEQSSGDSEVVVEAEPVKPHDAEALQTTIETVSVESMPLQEDGDIKHIQDSASLESTSTLSNRLEGAGSLVSRSLETDVDIKEMQELPAAETSASHSLDTEYRIERTVSVDSYSMQNGDDHKQTHDLSVLGASVPAAVEYENKTVSGSLVESESLLKGVDNIEVLEHPVIEASSVHARESGHQIGTVGSTEFNSLEVDENSEKLQTSTIIIREVCVPAGVEPKENSQS